MDQSVTSVATGMAAREVERSIARAMIRAGERERQRRRLELVGVPAERIDRLLEALARIARGGVPPTSQ